MKTPICAITNDTDGAILLNEMKVFIHFRPRKLAGRVLDIDSAIESEFECRLRSPPLFSQRFTSCIGPFIIHRSMYFEKVYRLSSSLIHAHINMYILLLLLLSRFHQMNFDRARRNGGHRSHDNEMPDPTIGKDKQTKRQQHYMTLPTTMKLQRSSNAGLAL